MLREVPSDALRIDTVAESAEVSPEVVDEFFDSRAQLVAEAQMANYFEIIQPLHRILSRVETAIVEGDETAFWEGVEENMVVAWGSGQHGDKWGIVRLLQDIWMDPFSQRHFCDLLDIQFARWIEVVEGAKRAGWVDPDMNAKALITFLWSASIGHIITVGSPALDLGTQDLREFFRHIVRSDYQRQTL